MTSKEAVFFCLVDLLLLALKVWRDTCKGHNNNNTLETVRCTRTTPLSLHFVHFWYSFLPGRESVLFCLSRGRQPKPFGVAQGGIH